MEFMTIKTAAQMWAVSERRVQTLCRNERIEGACKFGRDWAIPVGVEKPDDLRIKSGKYVNWRK